MNLSLLPQKPNPLAKHSGGGHGNRGTSGASSPERRLLQCDKKVNTKGYFPSVSTHTHTHIWCRKGPPALLEMGTPEHTQREREREMKCTLYHFPYFNHGQTNAYGRKRGSVKNPRAIWDLSFAAMAKKRKETLDKLN